MPTSDYRSVLHIPPRHASISLRQEKNNSCLLLLWIQILKIDYYSNFSIYQNSLQKTCPMGTKYSSNITIGLLS